jgi:predicted SAM-dependent methyltransferase
VFVQAQAHEVALQRYAQQRLIEDFEEERRGLEEHWREKEARVRSAQSERRSLNVCFLFCIIWSWIPF